MTSTTFCHSIDCFWLRESYNYEVKKKNSNSDKKKLGSGSGLRFLAGSGFNEYGSETLKISITLTIGSILELTLKTEKKKK